MSDTSAGQGAADSAAVFARAAKVLRSAGLPDDEMTAAIQAGPDELTRTVARYVTLPGRRYLRREAAADTSAVKTCRPEPASARQFPRRAIRTRGVEGRRMYYPAQLAVNSTRCPPAACARR